MLVTSSLKIWGMLLGAASVLASPTVLESLDETPAEWQESHPPDPDELIDFSIGLQPEDSLLLDNALYGVSDPDHPNYGKYLSRESAKALLKPSSEATESVKRWLMDTGIPEHHVRDEGEWLHVRTTVSQAEGMLSTRFSVFARDIERIVRTREYSVPHEIVHHVASIQPTTFFPSFDKTYDIEDSGLKLTKRDDKYGKKPPKDGNNGGPGPINLEKCKTELTPACIREIYKMPKDYQKAEKGSLYTAVSFLNMTAQNAQLQEFFRRFAPDLEGVTFRNASAEGGENPQSDRIRSNEGNLNTQYAISLAHQVPVEHLTVGGFNYDFNPDLDLLKVSGDFTRSIENWLGLAQYLLNLPDKKLPQVVSISWGNYEQHIPKKYARQVCNKFGQIGTRGVSILVAAGNFGVGVSCQSNDGKNTTKFLPTWPSVCPYVTSVGGTESNSPERAWLDADYDQSGGGGFSDLFSRPAYQDKVVKDYLKKNENKWKKWQKYISKDGRAFPDVAALASGHQVMVNGQQFTAGGTSAATPTVGAIIALLNNERFKKGKPAMGFLNPWLYKTGNEGFTDILEGNTSGCPGISLEGLTSPEIPNAGWDAVKGWDPATGFGTPRYDKLKKLAT
ncbi:tripeptidyl-peptidase 1 precursor [Fusarium beomiforme]|uniref:tripeptidyl-peptidase II n=1 Tax=Fusarium beomiforme TaxID=44412 RepID=A0A9P5DZQ2_9HYPO|nr:tripeptidyl-peptidase 1 precursor [Fusarium beomiforme]